MSCWRLLRAGWQTSPSVNKINFKLQRNIFMSINVITLVFHVLSVIIWVGGMFFAYMCLRPIAASQLEPPVRLQLWVGVFGKFFPFVWLAVILLPLTGYMMISNIYNGMGNAPLYVHLMNGVGSLMIFIYLIIL